MLACGLAPFRYGVERRGGINRGRVRKNAVERETVVGAVNVGGSVGRAHSRVRDVPVGRVRGGRGRRGGRSAVRSGRA